MSVEHDAIVGVKCDRGGVNRIFQGECFLKNQNKDEKGTFRLVFGVRTYLFLS